MATAERTLTRAKGGTATCPHCEGIFERRGGRDHKIYCSSACKRAAAYQRQLRGERPKIDPKPCAQCGETFTPTYPAGQTCSSRCADERAKLRRRERRAEQAAREERLRVVGIEPLPPGVGRSIEEVADSIDRGRSETRLLLNELKRDGIAEVSLGRWRLTPQAEAEFGVAFRSLLELQI